MDELAFIGHDLKNKLSIITLLNESSLKLVEKNPLPIDELKLKLGKTSENLAVAKKICNAMMGEEEALGTDIGKVIDKFLSNYHSLSFRTIFFNNSPCDCPLNLVEVYRIFGNLIRNSQEIGASIFLVELNEREIICQDNGGGIDSKLLDGIYQGQFPDSQHGARAGLGLQGMVHICKKKNIECNFLNNQYQLPDGILDGLQFKLSW